MVSIICSSFLFGPSSFCDCRKLSLNCLTEAEPRWRLCSVCGPVVLSSLSHWDCQGWVSGDCLVCSRVQGLGFRVYWCVQGSDISAGRGCFGHNAKLKVAA